MKLFFSTSILLATYAWLTSVMVLAIPTWENIAGAADSIGSLVPGASYIEALGPYREGEVYTRHLTVPIPGVPGNLTISPNSRAPGLFYINRGQLWQYINATSIFHVNVVNTTTVVPGMQDIPVQLVLDSKRTGIKSGSFRWKGTMLYYDYGQQTNQGVYYSCAVEGGGTNLFMFLKPSPTPAGCSIVTLHSFSREYVGMKKQ